MKTSAVPPIVSMTADVGAIATPEAFLQFSIRIDSDGRGFVLMLAGEG